MAEDPMPAPREDPFTPIHKALRSMLYGLSGRLQTHDFSDRAATTVLAADLQVDFEIARSAGCVICVLSHHASDEEALVFPPAARAAGHLIAELIEEHHGLTRREEAIVAATNALLELGPAEGRVEAGARLNRQANELLAAYVTHMNREESELVPLMQRNLTDPEMAAMRTAIIAKMPPERLLAIVGWMLPSLNVHELSGLLSAIGKQAPPPMVQALAQLGEAKVDPAIWSQARTRAGW